MKQRTCAGCGTQENLASMYGQLYIGPKDGHQLSALPKVNICKPCLRAFMSGEIDSRTVGVHNALAKSVKHGYNAISRGRR